MFTIFDTLNTKATQMSETMKTSFNNMDSMKSILDETNEKMSRMFSTESVANGNGYNADHVTDTTLLGTSRCSTSHAVTTADNMDGVSELPGYDESLPGYAKPTAYLEESEVCRQVHITNRKLTEADLDSDDPLYCDRETRERQSGSSTSVASDQSVENAGLFAEFAQCIMDQLMRLKYLIMENFLLS